jgi:hypothetical protein
MAMRLNENANNIVGTGDTIDSSPIERSVDMELTYFFNYDA